MKIARRHGSVGVFLVLNLARWTRRKDSGSRFHTRRSARDSQRHARGQLRSARDFLRSSGGFPRHVQWFLRLACL